MAAGEFTPAQVQHIWDREGGRCFRCRRYLNRHERGTAWSIHHRRPRGSGGTRRVMTCADGLLLCGHATDPVGCHHWAEKHRTVATELGLLIPLNAKGAAWAADVRRVRRLDGTWWLLTDDGKAIEVEGGNR